VGGGRGGCERREPKVYGGTSPGRAVMGSTSHMSKEQGPLASWHATLGSVTALGVEFQCRAMVNDRRVCERPSGAELTRNSPLERRRVGSVDAGGRQSDVRPRLRLEVQTGGHSRAGTHLAQDEGGVRVANLQRLGAPVLAVRGGLDGLAAHAQALERGHGARG
jgi:hypothetical protein